MSFENAQTEPIRVALYIRVSTEDQGKQGGGYGLEMQEEALRNLIKSRGTLPNGKGVWELAGENHVYIDEISGIKSPDERPAFSRLKEDISMAPEGTKPFDAVAVYKIDRFARRLRVLLEIVDFFEEHEIQFISANESIDTATPFGRAIFGIIGVIAELERETIRMRTRDGWTQAVKSGIAMGKYPPYGYKKAGKYRIIFPEEAVNVKEIFRLCIEQKMTPDQIAQELRRREILSPEASAFKHGKKKGPLRKKSSPCFWRPDSVINILKDEIYTGRIYYDKKVDGKLKPKEEWKAAEAAAPIIIDDILFQKAQELLESAKHVRKQTSSGYTYLLSGLLRCDVCYEEPASGGMTHWAGERKELGKGSGRYTYIYKCGRKNDRKYEKTCTALPLPAKEIEEYIIKFCKKVIQDPQAAYDHQIKLKSSRQARQHLDRRFSEVSNLLNALPGQKGNAEEMRLSGDITPEKFRQYLDEIKLKEQRYKAELDRIRLEMAKDTLNSGTVTALEAFSQKYKESIEKTLENRSDASILLHELIEEVIIYSRPVRETDTIAGKRKKDQQIPFRLHIKLKLPEELLKSIPTQFGVETTYLSG